MNFDTTSERTPRGVKEKDKKSTPKLQSMQKFSQNNIFDEEEKNLQDLIQNQAGRNNQPADNQNLQEFKEKIFKSILELLSIRCGLKQKIFDTDDEYRNLWVIKIQAENQHLKYMAQLFDYALEIKNDPRLLDNERHHAQKMPHAATMVINNLSHEDDKLIQYFRTYPTDEKRNEFKEILNSKQKKQKDKISKIAAKKPFADKKIPLSLYYGVSKSQNNSLFKQSDRIILTSKMIEKVFNPNYLIHRKLLQSYRAFHQGPDKKLIVDKISSFKNFYKPMNNLEIDTIRDYYGTQVAFQFAWLNFYTKSLQFPSVIGVALMLMLQVPGLNRFFDTATLYIICSIFMTIYISMFYENWIKKEYHQQYRWGCVEFEHFDKERIFDSKIIQNQYTDSWVKTIPEFKTKMKKFVTTLLLFVGVASSIIIFKTIFGFRQQFLESEYKTNAQLFFYLTEFIWVIQLQVTNALWLKIANKLNDYENHQFQSEQLDSLVFKKFCFIYVNSQSALFYVAFVKSFIGEQCSYKCNWHMVCHEDCMFELVGLLWKIFLVSIIMNIFEFGIPYVRNQIEKDAGVTKAQMKEHMKKLKEEKEGGKVTLKDIRAYSKKVDRKAELEKLKERKRLKQELSPREQDSEMKIQESQKEQSSLRELELVEYAGVLDEYLEMIIQFGQIAQFSVAFPLGPLIALLNNHFELRLDCQTLARFNDRTFCTSANGIGTWKEILQLVAHVSCLTNVGLLCFTFRVFRNIGGVEHSSEFELLMLIAIEHAFLAFKWLLEQFFRGKPEVCSKWTESHDNVKEKFCDRLGGTKVNFEFKKQTVDFEIQNILKEAHDKNN